MSAASPPLGPRPLKVKRLDEIVAPGRPRPPDVEFLIEDLIAEGSAGLFVGSSGKGKTPFLVQMGICVSSGLAFLGRQVKQKRVLFIDAESLEHQYNKYCYSLCRHLGLTAPSGDFMVHSVNWHSSDGAHTTSQLKIASLVRQYEPGFVIMDCLRPLFPDAEKDPTAAAALWQWQRKLALDYKLTLLTVHHTRKAGKHQGQLVKPDLAANPMDWFEEASGHSALINQADFRLGWDMPSIEEPDALIMAGFSKSTGPINAIHLDRIHDDNGYPQGYVQACERMFRNLQDKDLELWRKLAATPAFTPDQAKFTLGISSNGTLYRKFNRLMDAGLIRPKKLGGRTKYYERLTPGYAREAIVR